MYPAVLAILFVVVAFILAMVIRLWQLRIQSDTEQHILDTAREAQNKQKHTSDY